MTDWPILGHQLAVRQLQQAVSQDNVPHALLITGPENVGKMTLAHTLAQAMLCTADEDRPCGVCRACRKVAAGHHPDLLVISPEGPRGKLKIEAIRAAEQFLALTPHESRHKLVLVEHFEQATIGAANALLKTLEEPPGYAHLVLLAADSESLLPTIVSRTNQIALRPLPVPLVEQALQSRWHVPAAEAERLARISGGRIGWAVRAVDEPEHLQQMEAAIAQWLALMSSHLPEQFAALKDLSRSDTDLRQMLAYWLIGWRDVLLLKTQAEAPLTLQEHRAALEQIAERVTIRQITALIERISAAQALLQRNVNAQLLLETLLLAHQQTR